MMEEDESYDKPSGSSLRISTIGHESKQPSPANFTNRELSQVLNEALAFQTKSPTIEVNWLEEELIEKEIADLLDNIDQQNIAENFKTQMRKKIVEAVKRVAQVAATNSPREAMDKFEFPAITSFGKIDDKKTSLDPALSPPKPTTDAIAKAESLAIVMMQKKMSNMRKQLELAEQKARSVTMQW
eukprot:scaffold96_cov167-Ochromonas_danica.AAC.33